MTPEQIDAIVAAATFTIPLMGLGVAFGFGWRLCRWCVNLPGNRPAEAQEPDNILPFQLPQRPPWAEAYEPTVTWRVARSQYDRSKTDADVQARMKSLRWHRLIGGRGGEQSA